MNQPRLPRRPGPRLGTRVAPLTRRRFLAFSGVAAAGALAVGATQVRWADLVTRPPPPRSTRPPGVLVVVTLYGGNDGLNTVVPAADPAYQQARADLAYRPEEVLDLGEGLGLNPGMTGLHELWGSNQLAIVRGVGYPQARPQPLPLDGHLADRVARRPRSDDRLARPLAGRDHHRPAAGGLARLGAAAAAGRGEAGRGVVPADRAAAAQGPTGPSRRLCSADRRTGDGLWQAQAAKSFADLQSAAARPRARRAKPTGPTPTIRTPRNESSKGASAGGQCDLAAQLDTVATLVEMGVPTRVYSVSLGGFDTHSDERGTQQRLLTELDAALTTFPQRLQATDRGRQVVTMVYSEFGRRVMANASDGTDHGTAGPVFVLGRGVQGGLLGTEPSLTDLDDGDLRATTDFRSVYATLLDRVLDADPGQVLAGHAGTVDGLFV